MIKYIRMSLAHAGISQSLKNKCQILKYIDHNKTAGFIKNKKTDIGFSKRNCLA
jgi:hypothetical protein